MSLSIRCGEMAWAVGSEMKVGRHQQTGSWLLSSQLMGGWLMSLQHPDWTCARKHTGNRWEGKE